MPALLTIVNVSYSSILSVEFTRTRASVAVFIITWSHTSIIVTVGNLRKWGRFGGWGLGGRDVDRSDEVITCMEIQSDWLFRT